MILVAAMRCVTKEVKKRVSDRQQFKTSIPSFYIKQHIGNIQSIIKLLYQLQGFYVLKQVYTPDQTLLVEDSI